MASEASVAEAAAVVLERRRGWGSCFFGQNRFVGCRRSQSGVRELTYETRKDQQLRKRIQREGGRLGEHPGGIDLLYHLHSSLFASVNGDAGCCTLLVTTMLSSFTFSAARVLALSNRQRLSILLLPLHER